MLAKHMPHSDSTTATAHQKLIYMTVTALFAACICVTTAYFFHIPVGTNGGYVHVGDALIYIAASVLPMPYALIAAALGGTMADLLTAPAWALATFLIKMLIALPLTSKKETIVNIHNIIGIILSGFISMVGYSIAEVILFGTWASLLSSVLATLVQSGGSAVVFLLLGRALDQIHFKTMFHNMTNSN